MKILRLEAENFKRLKAVEIIPSGPLVQITGRNAHGKSSVLDAIWAALGGATHIQSEPIRKGETRARIRLDMGEIVVTRTITERGSTLTVENAEGAAYKSPQKLLDDLVGALAFDPLAFVRMKPREQFDQLRAIAELDLDLDHLDALNRRDYDRRADLNREAKTLRAQIEGLPAGSAEIGETRDITKLTGQLKTLNEVHAKALREQGERERKQSAITQKKERIEELRRQAVALQAEIKGLEEELSIASCGPGPEEVAEDIRKVTALIEEAQGHNEAANAARQIAQRRADLETRADDLESQSRDLTLTMEARQATKLEAIAAAKVPVPGLSFGEGAVLFNGVPFDQSSSAEQLRVSVAIAMAANPKLRVLRILEGSLLDEDGLALVAQMAAEKDYQVWIERVDSSGQVGVVIHEGEVAADHTPKATAPEGPSLFDAWPTEV